MKRITLVEKKTMIPSNTLSRRQFVNHTVRGSAALLAGLPMTAGVHASKPATPRPKVAAIFTIFRFRSHAYNILENFFEPYLFNGKLRSEEHTSELQSH